jgi:alpha-tubulin suppressor-like RCC1 family protein
VWAWGAADRGQSGLGGKTYAPAPRRVEAFGKYHSYETVKVQQIAAGDAHSLLLTQSGDVYVCGDNYRGQLGLAPSAEVVALDKEREAMEQELHFLQQARPPPPLPPVQSGHVSSIPPY